MAYRARSSLSARTKWTPARLKSNTWGLLDVGKIQWVNGGAILWAQTAQKIAWHESCCCDPEEVADVCDCNCRFSDQTSAECFRCCSAAQTAQVTISGLQDCYVAPNDYFMSKLNGTYNIDLIDGAGLLRLPDDPEHGRTIRHPRAGRPEG